MGKTRDLFKKIRDTKGTFHAKMGSVKDRNGIDLTEAENIKKNTFESVLMRWMKLELLFFLQLFVRPPQTAILLFCISFPWGWS